MLRIKRREFITLLGGAAAWPVAAGGQQPAIRVIGRLNSNSPGSAAADRAAAFLEGLKEGGFIEGRNVTIETRWAEGHNARLVAMAAALVGRNANVIVAGGIQAA